MGSNATTPSGVSTRPDPLWTNVSSSPSAFATSVCSLSVGRDNQIPIILFDLARKGNILRVVCGEPVGSTVRG